MRVQRRLGEIAVIGLVVYLESQVAIGEEQIADVEVTNERGVCCLAVVAIAKLAVDEQSVVKQATADKSLILSVVPSFRSSRDVSTEVPAVVLDYLREHAIDLR